MHQKMIVVPGGKEGLVRLGDVRGRIPFAKLRGFQGDAGWVLGGKRGAMSSAGPDAVASSGVQFPAPTKRLLEGALFAEGRNGLWNGGEQVASQT
jgi:hypothetical protein